MGQQQLLLIVLGVIVVGIAVVVGISAFGKNAEQSNRDAVANDLVSIAAQAQQVFRRPVQLGGKGGTFVLMNMTDIGIIPGTATTGTNANGVYTVEGTPTATLIRFKGVPAEVNNPTLWIAVGPGSVSNVATAATVIP